MLSEISRRLAERATRISGSSNRVGRALVLAERPSLGDGEITAKGNLNFRKVLDRRSAILERLYDDRDPATVTISGVGSPPASERDCPGC